MQELIGSNGSFINVPRIPANLTTAAEVAMLIPEGFEEILKVQIKSDEVHLTLLHDEYKDNVINLPSVLYNPLKNHIEFPKFLLERSIFQNKVVDYFADDPEERYILNQNELLYAEKTKDLFLNSLIEQEKINNENIDKFLKICYDYFGLNKEKLN